MITRGIILAGGRGTRIGPITKSISKQIIPLYDKPTIFYSLSILMLINIREILIITKQEDIESYKRLLGNGSNFGIKIIYKIQEKPIGLPDAFLIGENFINKNNIALILGDNFFHGQSLIQLLNQNAKEFKSGAQIFTYIVKNPQDYGVVERLKSNNIRIIEKPSKPKSNEAITGLYFFDKSASKIASKLKFSERGELEIVEMIKYYLRIKKLKTTELGRGSAWLDTGTCDDILKASNYINIIENRQNQKIGCLEEISFKKKWISKKKMYDRIKFYGQNEYSKYLKNLIT
jgi:glucose-1-phosphate thymidylyltransferase